MRHTARHAHQAKSHTKVNATTPVLKAFINKAQHVTTAPAHAKNVATSTTAHNVNHPTFSLKDSAASNVHPLTI
jgi:hypothetical protein